MNYIETAKTVKDYLKCVTVLKQQVKVGTIATLGSPKFDGMPKAEGFQNGSEKSVVKQLEDLEQAQYQLKVIKGTMSAVGGKEECSTKILMGLYFDNRTDKQLADKLGYSMRQYFRRKQKALCEFALTYQNVKNLIIM